MKRLFDIAAVVVAAPLWIFMGAVVAVLTAVFMGFPIFYSDERAGKNGRPFRMWKFRTMRTGAGGDGERLTRFGRFLRASSLDELPELWHVLAGEMSLVGPRPLPIRYLARYSPEQARRHEVLPGITGWAQVHGRNSLTWEEKFRYDVDYVDSWSFYLDVKILFMTIFQVFRPGDVNHAGEATMPEFVPDRSAILSLLLPVVITAQPLSNPEVLEQSVLNEVEHAINLAPTNVVVAAATADEFVRACTTNSPSATDLAISLVSSQKNGCWFWHGTNVTPAAVWLLRRIKGEH